MQKKNCKTKALLAVLYLLCWPCKGQAQTIIENQRMRFGTIVMHDNSSPKDLQLLPGGGFVADYSGYYIIDSGPQLGSYTVQGQTPNWPMNITLSPATTIHRSGGGPFFTLVDFFTVPASVMTDGLGSATFQVGATLRSSGFMGNYVDDAYNGQYTITVSPAP